MKMGSYAGRKYMPHRIESEVLWSIDRPKYRELKYSPISKWVPEKYDLVQLKMDGMWGVMTIGDGGYTITSRTGKKKAEGEIDFSSKGIVLLGEYIKNSHWGHKKGLDGNFYAFDCLQMQGMDIREEPLNYRLECLREVLIDLGGLSRKPSLFEEDDSVRFITHLATPSVDQWTDLWDNYVMKRGYEGLIFKDSKAPYGEPNAWARMKAIVEIEYVCTDFRLATKGTKYEGQYGAVIGELIDKDTKVTCGGLSEVWRREMTTQPEKYIGKVFTAKGNAWYPSGALRHPMFKRWRFDKTPDECTYDQIPEECRA